MGELLPLVRDRAALLDLQPKAILVRMPNWIGDIILATPTLASLRQRFPQATIAVLVRASAAQAVSGSPLLDELIAIGQEVSRGLAGRWLSLYALRQRRFDLALVLPNSFRAALEVYATGAGVRLGYARGGRSPLLTHPVACDAAQRRKHHAEYFHELVQVLGSSPAKRSVFFPLTEEAKSQAERFFLRHGLHGVEPVVAVHPGASKPQRGWHEGRFARLLDAVIDELGAKVLLLGGSADFGTCREILDQMENRPLTAIGQADLQQTAGLIARSHLFVGNDSGPMHLAAAVGTPIVAIFGPGEPSRTGPYWEGPTSIVAAPAECRPCRQRFFRDCAPSAAGKPPCIEDVTVEVVLSEVRALLQRRA